MFVESGRVTEVTLEPWRQVLLDAADYIETYGWCQHDIRDEQGRVCIVGAMKAVRRDNAVMAFEILSKNLRMLPSRWNDDVHRTKEQVVAKLREVAYG